MPYFCMGAESVKNSQLILYIMIYVIIKKTSLHCICVIFQMLCIMLSILRIDRSGMGSLSLFKSGLVRWMYGGDIKHVVLKTGEIGAFDGHNLGIVARNADVSEYLNILRWFDTVFKNLGFRQFATQILRI